MSKDFGGDFITIADEEGNEFELEILDVLDVDGVSYTVFVPANIDEMDVNDPDYGLIFLRNREENGEEFFDSIDDDAELDRVYELYNQLLDDGEALLTLIRASKGRPNKTLKQFIKDLEALQKKYQ